MRTKDVEKVWRVLRNIGTTPSAYVSTYLDICRAILETVSLCPLWEEGLRAIVSGDGLEQWGKKWQSFYTMSGNYAWMWAIRFMSNERLDTYIKEFAD